MQPDDDARLDRALERFGALMRQVDERQTRMENRITGLFALSLVAFVIVVVSLSFLTIILSRQVPSMTAAIAEMNTRFADIADDMVAMERSVARMRADVDTLPRVVWHMDGIHGSVAFMSNDVASMAGDLGTLDDTVIGLSASVHDMRQSFEFMQQNVGRMGTDVNHLSQPMRMFNFFNPFR
jgi:uncharacterized protein YoxC